MQKQEILDVLIIGAGPAGCVSGAYLYKQNLNIKILEKHNFPRFTIGESLLPRCMDHFRETGFFEAIEKQNFQVKVGARMFKNRKLCEINFKDNFSGGSDWTWQVPRAKFDKTLTDDLESRGVSINFDTEVLRITRRNGIYETQVEKKGGETETILSEYLLDCSGNGRVLPREFGLIQPSKLPEFGSVFTHVKDFHRDGTENKTSFEVIDQKTWIWVIPVSDEVTSVGIVAPLEKLNEKPGSPERILRSFISESLTFNKRFNNSEFLFKPIQVKNYASNIKRMYGKKYVITGNSAEFIDPVFSSGVTFATESGLLAAKLIYREMRGESVDWEIEYSEYLRKGISVFESFVKEWYSGNLQTVFFDTKFHNISKRQISSVLAGYVWDYNNPFVEKHQTIIGGLAQLSKMQKRKRLSSIQ